MDRAQVTVLVPTSAIPSHPDTTIMDETIAGIRFHFPNSPIIIMADGIWEKLECRRGQYEAYLTLVETKYDPKVRVVRFQQHTQQTAMSKYCIENFVQTPYIFFNEHDAPLRTDRFIDWDEMLRVLSVGDAGLVRFTVFEEGIHEAHEHLTRGRWKTPHATWVRTTQFSGWSFLTTTKYLIDKIFTKTPIGKEMIEIRMYERVANSAWEDYKVVIYCPDPPAARFRHSNGRGFGVEERDPCDWG